MATKFYNLLSPFHAHYGESMWVIRFASWLISEFNITASEPLAGGWNPRNYAFTTGPSQKPDFPAVVGEWQACSRGLAGVLQTVAPGRIEFLPFRTQTWTGEDQTDNYSVMHYMTCCRAIDRKRSWPKEKHASSVSGEKAATTCRTTWCLSGAS